MNVRTTYRITVIVFVALIAAIIIPGVALLPDVRATVGKAALVLAVFVGGWALAAYGVRTK